MSWEPVLVVAPHPDDETLGCGGSIALHLDRGDSVAVIWLTSGEAGIPEVSITEAAATRRKEAEAAMVQLALNGDQTLRVFSDYGVMRSGRQSTGPTTAGITGVFERKVDALSCYRVRPPRFNTFSSLPACPNTAEP